MPLRATVVLAADLALQISATRHAALVLNDVGARRSLPDGPILPVEPRSDEALQALVENQGAASFSSWLSSFLGGRTVERIVSEDVGAAPGEVAAPESILHAQATLGAEPSDRELPPPVNTDLSHVPASETEELQRLNALVGESEEALTSAATDRREPEDAIARVGDATLRGCVRKYSGHLVASFWDIPFAKAERWRHGALVDVEGGDYSRPPKIICLQWASAGFKGTEDCLALDVYVNLADAETETGKPSGATEGKPLDTDTEPEADEHEGDEKTEMPEQGTKVGDPEGQGSRSIRLLVKAAREAAQNKDASSTAKPVLVWIHGGAFAFGNKYAGGVSDGMRLAAKHGVVIVCINYRLGPLGFLAHPGLEQTNFGVHDQYLGLKWVNQHIHAFGGDPNRVTIFGQSAGAASVCVHLASPVSREFFQKAYVGSGNCDGPFFLKTLPQGKAMGKSYVQSMFYHPPAVPKQPGDARATGDVGNSSGRGAADHDVSESAAVAEGVKNKSFLRGLSRIVTWPLQSTRSIEVELDPPIPIEEVSQACSHLFEDVDHTDTKQLRCDDADDECHGRLLECARLLGVSRVWRNKFGVEKVLSEAKEEFGWLYRWLGLSLTGLPVELPWKPLVTVTDEEDDGREGRRLRRKLTTTGELQHPLQSLEHEPADRVTTMFSFTSDEGSIFVPIATLFVPSLGKAFRCDTADPGKLNKQQCDQVTQQFADHVFCPSGKSCDRSMTVGWAYRGGFGIRRIITDYFFACPMIRAADTLARHGLKSYVYKFAIKDLWNSWLPLKHLGAFHTVDTYFSFGTGEEKCAGKFTSICQWSEFHRSVSDELMAAIADLAEGRSLQQWDPLTDRGRGDARLWTTNEAHNHSVMAMKAEHNCDYLWNEIEGAERWERQSP